MKTCTCSGNNSLRLSIGGFRCECGGKLTDQQANFRLFSQLQEVRGDIESLKQAITALDGVQCRHCGEYKKKSEVFQWQDRTFCFTCLSENRWSIISTEDDDEQTFNGVHLAAVRAVVGTKHFNSLPRMEDGMLQEPFLWAYHRISKL